MFEYNKEAHEWKQLYFRAMSVLKRIDYYGRLALEEKGIAQMIQAKESKLLSQSYEKPRLRTKEDHEIEASVGDMDVLVGFDYEPEEPMVRYPAERAYPGSPAQAIVVEVLTKEGHDIMEYLSQETIEVLEEKCLDDIQRDDRGERYG